MLAPRLSTGSNEIFIKKEKKGEDRERGGGSESIFFYSLPYLSIYFIKNKHPDYIYLSEDVFNFIIFGQRHICHINSRSNGSLRLMGMDF